MGFDYNAERGLLLADSSWIVCNITILLSEIIIIVKYLIPLRIKSPYLLLFYIILAILLLANIVEAITRLYNGDPGFLLNWQQKHVSLGIVSRQIGDVTYILLGFVLSAIMFQLSVSLSLILNIIDLEEAN